MQESPYFVLCKTVCTGPTKVSSKVGLLEGFLDWWSSCCKTNLKAPNRVRRESGVEVIGLGLSWCREYIYEGLGFGNRGWRTSCVL